MAYSEKLAERVRGQLKSFPHIEEKKMMGGLTFMVNDRMCVGVHENDLMVRLDLDIYDKALKKKGCRLMDFTGKPMKGFVFVGATGTSNKKDLSYWINLGLDFNKKAKPSKKN